MKAITRSKYGGPEVLSHRDVEKPQPKADEVIVRVLASSINRGDLYMNRGSPFIVRLMGAGILRPKVPILGGDVAGVVDAAGDEVKRFKVGDRVFGDLTFHKWGAYAEFALAREMDLAVLPGGVSFEHGGLAGVSGQTALQGLRDAGKIAQGEKVLVIGANSGVGMWAVQIARTMGAQVTAALRTKHMANGEELVADHLVDSTDAGFLSGQSQYDLILDCAAYRKATEYLPVLADNGRYVVVGGTVGHLIGTMLGRKRKERGITFSVVRQEQSADDLALIGHWMAEERITPIIDSAYPLDRLADALAHFENGRPMGKVAIHVTE